MQVAPGPHGPAEHPVQRWAERNHIDVDVVRSGLEAIDQVDLGAVEFSGQVDVAHDVECLPERVGKHLSNACARARGLLQVVRQRREGPLEAVGGGGAGNLVGLVDDVAELVDGAAERRIVAFLGGEARLLRWNVAFFFQKPRKEDVVPAYGRFVDFHREEGVLPRVDQGLHEAGKVGQRQALGDKCHD